MEEENKSGYLTKEQIEFYNEEGYIVLDRFLTNEELAPVQEAMTYKVSMIADELFRDGLIEDKLVDRPFKYRLAELFQHLTAEDFLKYGRSWRDRIPGYFHLMSNIKILNAVESLIGGELFSNPVYNVRPKIPRVAAGAVPWHQDKSYWPDANSNPVITVWIPLVDANEVNGCLHIKPKTHRKPLLKWHQETETGTGYTALKESQLGNTKTVVLPVSAGSAILFNDRCLHMSTPNLSNEVRWSVDLRYQPTDQDPMLAHGAGFLARSYKYPERVAALEDWLEGRPEHL
ncbi:phytanoyl-CoA dioxygenase family protein [Paenibacillus alginolyticus]|uniref:Phytanoyl-CoA dioxygenase family protein n=1 Tax=Paenibacillus alginolyticus TaxID=59839 RepID=A0ABT4GBN6_9BACL|nr:phytanoyl-CoA dioxygenase family protein [Paenibacillus alginolyticus]MCY9668474.1 phytanoyl-CoA dioxygenase family protein [Paenibacillus alginolyticus]MCY9693602.1 phytanoyl-CoA dioxygenase family protein [Paenibacillus alginolyticus]MEC0146647.1 phytanoyl-CoA dioxygenase family protein [Paenibacillus alginolyticus]